ncbi:hypothetical protein BSNK01_14290 [Bacillaceae bacterium]
MPVCRHFVPLLVNLGFPKEKIAVLYGGINVDVFSYKPRMMEKGRKVRIINVGKTAQKKGQRYLIQAFAKLAREFPNLELLIVSQKHKNENDKRVGKELEKLIGKYDLRKKVTFRFDLTESEVARELHHAHIYVQPSITSDDGNMEGIPNALKEAMSTGMPVVATKHAGIPELVTHEKNGFLVEEKNIEQMTKMIALYLKNPKLWNMFGKKARETIVDKFNLSKQIDYQEELYDRFLQRVSDAVKQTHGPT